MKRWRKEVIVSLEQFKAKDPFAPLCCLPVYSEAKVFQGYLRPVTWDYEATLPGCAGQLAAWRNENPSFSPDCFTATKESTADWLNRDILAREDRILFLVLAADGARVGHIGFSSLEERERSMEVDAVLRGEKVGFPGLMGCALNTLIRWGLQALKLKKITLRVLSDNARALAFYDRHFFYKTAEIPLYPISGPGRERWVTVQQSWEQPPGKFYSRMQLNIEQWKQANTDENETGQSSVTKGRETLE